MSDSVCCTRCGARGTRIENFCQQCGHSLAARAQETVVGACYHCGTSWRTGWLFCKTCGLDRDRALLRSTSSPIQPAQAQKTVADELPEIEKIFCKRCGTSAKPYSRFCETCGYTLEMPKDAPNTGKLKTPPAAAALRTQIENPVIGTQHHDEEPVQVGRTTQSDQAPPPRIVRRLTPEGERRKTVAFAKSGYTNNFPSRTDRIAADTDSAESGQGRGPVAGSPSQMKRKRGSQPAAGRSASPHAATREQRSVWPLIALGAMVLLAASIFIWWIRLRNQNLLPTSDQTVVSAPTEKPSPAAVSISPKTGASGHPPVITSPPGMVFVPGGTFDMGRDGADEAEGPVHKITVKPFFIDRTEVTNQEYQRFVAAAKYPPPRDWIGGKFPAGAENFPVVNITWEDANSFAKWAGKRLPNEAEWEFAARGTDGRLYPWGNDWNRTRANVGAGAEGRIVEVGRYQAGASPFGALDMCGNVWEWTSSKLLRYSDRTEIAPGRVVRGGAYNADERIATASYRGVLQLEKAYPRTGFRCVRDAQ